ncbi:MAG: tetraacyldisaccharide 4'-kinase [Rickettsiales bacterium]|jgi:tetraacyldisaccharide 4'-kinase|nr:tetraacyldisaccharide 4'-kinase [Rickettsiales bacterium]
MLFQQPKFWQRKGIIALVLFPLSLLYRFAAAVKRMRASPYRAKIPVVCIGNISIGGTGKTPIVEAVARFYIKKRARVAILSRGYGGSAKGPLIVRPGKHTAAMVGDEPLMLATALPRAKVVICADRAASAKLIENRADVIVMDDGLQNFTLAKTCQVCVVRGLGNGLTLPAGPLREPASALKKMDAIIAPEGMKFKGAHVFHSRTRFVKRPKHASSAMAGIGDPQRFFSHVESVARTKLTHAFAFPDHHFYTDTELEAVAKFAPVYTTSKDFVKIPDRLKKYFIEVKIKAEVDDEFFRILPKLNRARPR